MRSLTFASIFAPPLVAWTSRALRKSRCCLLCHHCCRHPVLWKARQQPQSSRKGDGAEEGLPADSSARSSGEKKQQGWESSVKAVKAELCLIRKQGAGLFRTWRKGKKSFSKVTFPLPVSLVGSKNFSPSPHSPLAMGLGHLWALVLLCPHPRGTGAKQTLGKA